MTSLTPRETEERPGDALEPALDKASLDVLRAVPAYTNDRGTTIWRIAETVESLDLQDLQLTLNGLEHLHYVVSSAPMQRKPRRWLRTRKGDEAVS